LQVAYLIFIQFGLWYLDDSCEWLLILIEYGYFNKESHDTRSIICPNETGIPILAETFHVSPDCNNGIIYYLDEESGPLPRILREQGAGTRQTVYEADAPGPATPADPKSQNLLLINRISTTTTTVVNDPNLSYRTSTPEESRRKTRKDDIYFDYGCV